MTCSCSMEITVAARSDIADQIPGWPSRPESVSHRGIAAQKAMRFDRGTNHRSQVKHPEMEAIVVSDGTARLVSGEIIKAHPARLRVSPTVAQYAV